MNNHKFDVKKLDKLNNPERIKMIDLDAVIKELALPKEAVLIDIGVGTGIFSEEFLNKIPDSKVYGFDISEDMVTWVNKNRVQKLAGRLEVSLMEESKIPLENNFADLVFMITVHHELDHAVALLKDVKRVLKDSGKLLICDWKEGVHKHFVSKESIVQDIKEAGFSKITEIETSEKLVCFICE